jgi:hypothetical protein
VRRSLVSLISALLVLTAPAVRAQETGGCAADQPWVALGGDVPASLAEAVRSDLRAGLAPSSIQVCAEPPPKGAEPLARVTIKPSDRSGARFSLDVTDSVTKKRIGRDVSLAQLPSEGRAFALAVAAEELLRASWAELALRGAHTVRSAPPPEVRAVVEEVTPAQVEPRPLRALALGGRLAFEHFLGGQTHFGADLFAVTPLGRVAGGVFALGARRGLSVQAPHGAVAASALSAEAGISLAFVQQPGISLDAFVSGRLLRLEFEPEAEPGSRASPESGWVVTSRAGLMLSFGRRGLLRSYSALGAGLPLQSFAASDSGRVITGATELELFASTGLALELP